MDDQRRHSRKQTLYFSLVLAIFGALIIEGSTRAVLWAVTRDPVVPPELGRPDPRLGWALVQGSRASSDRTGYEIEYRINSKGLRDDETSYPKPEGTFRIVVLGDSRTFGFGVPIEKHFSRLLEGYFSRVEVINLGVSGYGVDQELLFLRQEGFRYQPDLVLAYVAHYGDHRHMHSRRFGSEKPRFRLVDGVLVLTNSPVIDDSLLAAPGPIKSVHHWLRDRSATYRVLAKQLLRILRPRNRSDATNDAAQDAKDELDEGFHREMYALGAALVREIHDEAAAHGARFVLVTQIPELHAAMSNAGILSLDASDALANPAFNLPEKLGHINESGNGALAWEIARFLRERDLVPLEHFSHTPPPTS